MQFSNNSKDTISVLQYPWGSDFKAPLEYKEHGKSNWKVLPFSDLELKDVCKFEPSIGRPTIVFAKPKTIHPNSSDLKSTIHFPVSTYHFLDVFKEQMLYDFRIVYDTGIPGDTIFSNVVSLFIKKQNEKDAEFYAALKQKRITTFSLFVPWEKCPIGNFEMWEILNLKSRFLETHLAYWIDFQMLNRNLIIRKNAHKVEKDQAFILESKTLLELLIQKDFYPKEEILNTYQAVLEYESSKN